MKFPERLLAQLKETPDDKLVETFPKFSRAYLRKLKRKVAPDERVKYDLRERKLKASKSETDKKYKVLQDEISRLEAEKEAVLKLAKPCKEFVIRPSKKRGGGEATCIAVASDWHIEETVTPDAVNDLNEYNLDIAKKRAETFFQVALRLRDIECQNTPVPNMVLALLGDFITGSIHEENLAVCSLPPVEAAYEAKGILKGGIDFLLKNSDLNLVVPCHSGNHARITKKSRSSETERGNSLEYFIYGFLAQEYANEPRVKFLISKSYTSRLQVYDVVFRLHHGHRIRFQGGVGGLTIPAMKYVHRSNTAWKADYDIFGHHHQKQFGPSFICNGSMIGYNAYAQDSAFQFEEPSQTFLTVNKRWKEVIDYRPILFS